MIWCSGILSLEILKSLRKLGLAVKKEFSTSVLNQEPHVIRVFSRQLMLSIAAQDKHDFSSWPLWISFANSLNKKGFVMKISKFLRTKKKEEQEKELRSLVEDHSISSGLMSMLLLLQQHNVYTDNHETASKID